MSIRLFFISLVIAPMIILLSGCSNIRMASSLNKLSLGISKQEVEDKIGKPDEVSTPIIDQYGDVVEIWYYNLARLDKNQLSKIDAVRSTVYMCLSSSSVLFTGTIFLSDGYIYLFVAVPSLISLISTTLFMKSPYRYDYYFLKFVNNVLFEWGKRVKDEIDQ